MESMEYILTGEFFNDDKPERNNDATSPTTTTTTTLLLPTLIQSIKNQTQDQSTLQEVAALETSLQRLETAREGIQTLLEKEEKCKHSSGQAIWEGDGSSSSLASETTIHDATPVLDFEELERIVAGLEAEAAALNSVPASVPPAHPTNTAVLISPLESLQMLQKYQTTGAPSSGKVDDEQDDDEDAPLKSLDEIHQIADQKIKAILQRNNTAHASSLLQGTPSLTNNKKDDSSDNCVMTQEISNITAELSESFASWKEDLETILQDVQQYGMELEQQAEELEFATKDGNGSTDRGNGDDETTKENTILGRLQRVYRRQLEGVKSQLQDYRQRQQQQPNDTGDWMNGWIIIGFLLLYETNTVEWHFYLELWLKVPEAF